MKKMRSGNRTISRHLRRAEGQSRSFDIKDGFIAAVGAQITQTDLLWPRVTAGGKEKEVKQL